MRVLVLDLENSYITGGVWGLWDQSLGLDQILDSGKVLSCAFKWLGEKKIVFTKCTDDNFLPIIHNAISEADAIVTFNGRRHDLPLLNREFIKAGMGPPSPFRHIDLFETAKRVFKFPSNKLDWLLRELGLGQKVEHEGFKLWIKVLKDEPAAWKTMEKYNVADVRLTEKLYRKLLPWVPNHPNHSIYDNRGLICPTCGSSHVQRRGYYHTNAGRWPKFKCMDCSKWSRGRIMELDKVERKNMLVDAQ